MKAYQLSLFPNDEPVAIDDQNNQSISKRQFRPIIIDNPCTTARTAQLLNISTTTLDRAKNEGKSYRCGLWTATWIQPNCWQVTIAPNNEPAGH